MVSVNIKIISFVLIVIGIVSIVLNVLSLEKIKNACNNQFVINNLYVNIGVSSVFILFGIYGFFMLESKSFNKFAFG